MKSCVLGIMAMIAAISAGESFTFIATDANADWSDVNNYQTSGGATPAVYPGSSDTVTVQNCEYQIAVPSASFNAMKNFRRIIPAWVPVAVDAYRQRTYRSRLFGQGCRRALGDLPQGHDHHVQVMYAESQPIKPGARFPWT